MATIECGGCGLPRAASEPGKPCPVCAAGLGELSVESRRASHKPLPTDGLAADVSQLAAAPDSTPHGHRPEIVTAVLGLVVGAAMVFAVQGVLPSPRPSTADRGSEYAANPPVLPSRIAVEPLPHLDVSKPPVPPPIPLAAKDDEDAVVVPLPAPANKDAVVVPPLAPANKYATLFPESPAPGGKPAIILDVNRPDGSMQFTRINLGLGQKAVVRGRIKNVNFNDIEGLDIDASQLLILESATIRGPFKATSLKINSPGGKVIIWSRMSDESKLVVNAPGGEVSFNFPVSGVDSGSQVQITATKFECVGPIAGKDTHVELTIGSGGLIRAASIRDSAVVEYRKANRGDGPIHIVIPDNQIDKTAVLRRVE